MSFSIDEVRDSIVPDIEGFLGRVEESALALLSSGALAPPPEAASFAAIEECGHAVQHLGACRTFRGEAPPGGSPAGARAQASAAARGPGIADAVWRARRDAFMLALGSTQAGGALPRALGRSRGRAPPLAEPPPGDGGRARPRRLMDRAPRPALKLKHSRSPSTGLPAIIEARAWRVPGGVARDQHTVGVCALRADRPPCTPRRWSASPTR
jgi:hypothetical protein